MGDELWEARAACILFSLCDAPTKTTDTTLEARNLHLYHHTQFLAYSTISTLR